MKRFHGDSLDKLCHPRSVAYSAEQVLLNKQQIWCGGAYPDCYGFHISSHLTHMTMYGMGNTVLPMPYISHATNTMI